MADQIHFPPVRAWDSSANAASGAQATFFTTGTSTPLTIYSDAALSVAHAVPLVADSLGVFPMVFTDGTVQIKVNVTDSSGSVLSGYPIDPAIMVATSGAGASGISFTPSSDNSATNVQDAIDNNTNSITPLTETVDNSITAHLTAGSSNAFTITATNTITAYSAGQQFRVRFDRAPTGTASLNVDGLGLKAIQRYTSAGALANIAADDWGVGGILDVVYDGTRFVVMSSWMVRTSSSAQNVTGTSETVYPTVAGAKEIVDTHVPILFSASGSAPLFGARAWVNFDGTGAIQASGNVASVTRHSQGDYTITFSIAMQDANYAIMGFCNNSANTTPNGLVTSHNTFAPLAASCRVQTVIALSGAVMDPDVVTVAFIR